MLKDLVSMCRMCRTSELGECLSEFPGFQAGGAEVLAVDLLG